MGRAVRLSRKRWSSARSNLRRAMPTSSWLPPEHWPNLICVLGEGVIYHQKAVFEKCFSSETITSDAWPSHLSFGEDSLFQFYCAIHDVCAGMQLAPAELMRYYGPQL